MADDWHRLADPDEIPSPALLIYPERIGENIRRMIAALGQAERLRPHIKTHKMAEVVQLQLKAGITKFKCATIAEAEMLGQAGAKDVLLANQPVGPNIERLLGLGGWFRDVRFSTIADDAEAVGNLAEAAQAAGVTLPVWLDLDAGMGRTGIAPGQAAATLYKLIGQLPGVEPAGLHLYDGHLHDSDPSKRLAKWQTMMDEVTSFRTDIEAAGLPVPNIVGGGTPTFPFHAQHTDHECSPGTTLLWDYGYRDAFPDLDYQNAAMLLTRVISKPGTDCITLDLGHKAVAAENPHPRVRFIGLDDTEAVVHSEEHLTLRTTEAQRFNVGDCLYGIPRHICPTVALYDRAHVIRGGKLTDQWQVTARARKLTF
ncbi:D-TA family PLP-dependent enzyme [Verrucomicrobia bacterium]|nr:D-TA family PLP-dependent enzyme [Verrucomicrobiota bacterium]